MSKQHKVSVFEITGEPAEVVLCSSTCGSANKSIKCVTCIESKNVCFEVYCNGKCKLVTHCIDNAVDEYNELPYEDE